MSYNERDILKQNNEINKYVETTIDFNINDMKPFKQVNDMRSEEYINRSLCINSKMNQTHSGDYVIDRASWISKIFSNMNFDRTGSR